MDEIDVEETKLDELKVKDVKISYVGKICQVKWSSKKDIFRQNVVKGFYLLLFVAFFTDTTSTVKTSVLYGFILPICLAP